MVRPFLSILIHYSHTFFFHLSKLELDALDEILADLMPLLKDAASQLTGSSKTSFEDRIRSWNARLMEQGAPNADGGDGDEPMGEDETVMDVVREMTEWAVEFSLWVLSCVLLHFVF